MAEALVRITAKTAVEAAKGLALSDEARPLLKEGLTPQQFLAALEAGGHYPDAFRFLARALPKREAVFWAESAARESAGAKPPEPIAKALAAVHKWVLDPNEENRRANQAAYEAAEPGTPAGCAALAAFWSGGSLAPRDLPVVPPPEHLTAHGVASSVLLAAVEKDPAKVAERYKAILAQGLAVASGKLKWT